MEVTISGAGLLKLIYHCKSKYFKLERESVLMHLKIFSERGGGAQWAEITFFVQFYNNCYNCNCKIQDKHKAIPVNSSAIYNYSNITLSEPMVKLLNRGLNRKNIFLGVVQRCIDGYRAVVV